MFNIHPRSYYSRVNIWLSQELGMLFVFSGWGQGCLKTRESCTKIFIALPNLSVILLLGSMEGDSELSFQNARDEGIRQPRQPPLSN